MTERLHLAVAFDGYGWIRRRGGTLRIFSPSRVAVTGPAWPPPPNAAYWIL
jgi:hypothetical protein